MTSLGETALVLVSIATDGKDLSVHLLWGLRREWISRFENVESVKDTSVQEASRF